MHTTASRRSSHAACAWGVVVCLAFSLASPVVVPARAQSGAQADDPDRPWAAEADALVNEGHYEEALALYRDLTGAHAQDPGLWLRIALVELESGRPSQALAAAERARELAPTEMDPFAALAQIQAASGQPGAALDTLLQALEHHPGDKGLLETMTTLSIRLHRWPEAVGLLRELIRLDPDNPMYHVDLGRILLNQGAYDEAIETFERSVEVGADPASTRAMVGKAQLAAGRSAQAISSFESSLALAPNADAYGGLATIHYLRGEQGEAIRAFRKAIEQDPDDPDLQFNLGNVLAQTDRLEEAEEAYRRSLQLAPGSATTHTNLAVLLLNRFAVSEAQQHLLLAAQMDSSLPGPHLHLGRIAGAQYEYERAIEHYRNYRSRIRDEAERARVDTVIVQLQDRAREATQARARGEVHLLQLMVSSEDRARGLIDRLRRGEDFYVIAQQESELRELTGVDAGFLDPGSIHERFREPVRGLAVGEVTEPIRMENGFYVFKRVE